MQHKEFSAKAIHHLGYYVYLYVNPLNNTIFYVGKGRGNRAFAHLDDSSESQKATIIREIRERGDEPRIEILVHGLEDEMTALRIEAAVIDLLGIRNLANLVRGWGSRIVGRMEASQLMSLYDTEPADIDDPVLLIRINKLYRYGMSPLDLYEATRGVWRVGPRRDQAQYALAVYQGVVQEVYEISQWFPGGTTLYTTRLKEDVNAPERWEFTGEIAAEAIRSKYVSKSVKSYLSPNSQNPIVYVNC